MEWAGKGFTLLWGVIAIAFALVGNLFENLIQLVNITLLRYHSGYFPDRHIYKTIRANSVFYAAILSEILVLVIYSQEWVIFWLNELGLYLSF